MKVIIVGGVAGGMSAATRLRRLDEFAEIIVIEKGPYVSFANCGLPYHISGEIEDQSSLILQTPDKLDARFNLDVRVNAEVTAISKEDHTVDIKIGDQVVTESYDKLILSPGAKPFIPPIAGLDEANNAFSLRNVPDLERIMNSINQESEHAVVIGAGFIGLEMAENLKQRGLSVTLIEKADHILPPLDEEMAIYIQLELEKQGITVITSQSAVQFLDQGKKVILEDGREVQSDLTILSVGVQPESRLAKDAGLDLGLRGGILVDEAYQTSYPDIYAVGDAIVVKQQISGEDSLIPLASPANRQGRQVADVVAGYNRVNKGSIGTSIVRVFNMSAASTGLNERMVTQLGLDHQVVHINGKDHAGYYPGATDIMLKLVFNPTTGEIYGAQAVGEKGIDKRIDIIATAIKGKLTIFDLPELEFTYAPPFGSAKDPVNMIGYAAINLAEGFSKSIQWHELEDTYAKGYKHIDVRNVGELKNGQFPDSINIPLDELRDRLGELDKDQPYIVSCFSGQRSYIAERILNQNGFDIVNLDGAFTLYKTVRPNNLTY